MFDDSTLAPQRASIPDNLPISDVEDIFGATDEQPPILPKPSEQGEEAPSAVEAGVLKPKIAPVENLPRPAPVIMPSIPEETGEMMEDDDQIQSPRIGRRLLFLVIGAILLTVIGGGSWWLYATVVKPPKKEFQGAPKEVVPKTPITTPSSASTQQPLSASALANEVVEESVLFGEPVDTDGDGLDTLREQSIGTNPTIWDTDKDELGDGDEVLIWKTDPLNPDSDGDTFLDGVEIKNGYSPTGPGKIFEPPSDTQ